MAGLGFVEAVEGGLFAPNAITKHMVTMPSAQHGALHLYVPINPQIACELSLTLELAQPKRFSQGHFSCKN